MTKSLYFKFGIGFVAGLCAALFPRLIAALATPGESEFVALFNWNYILLSLMFAALIGVVIAILEWEAVSSPKDIFMSSLAIPGILSGALNTAVSVNGLEQAEMENRVFETTLEQTFDIPTLMPATLTPLSKAIPSGSKGHQFSLFFINDAHAENRDFYRVVDYGFGIRKSRRSYVVVLDQARTREEAETKAAALRNSTPVKIFRDNSNRFFITTSSGPQNKANALNEAVRLKKKRGLTPSLLEIK